MSILSYSVQKSISGGAKSRAIVESYQNGYVTVILTDNGQRLTNLQTPETQLKAGDSVTVDYSNNVPYVYYETIPAEPQPFGGFSGTTDDIKKTQEGVCSGKVIASGEEFVTEKFYTSHLQVKLDTVLWDTHNAWDNANNCLVIPKSGIYLIEFTCRIGNYIPGKTMYQFNALIMAMFPRTVYSTVIDIGFRNNFNYGHPIAQDPGIQLHKIWNFSEGARVTGRMDIDIFGDIGYYTPCPAYSSLFERGAYPTLSWALIQEIPAGANAWAIKFINEQ